MHWSGSTSSGAGRPGDGRVTFVGGLFRITERAWAGQVDTLAALFGWLMWRDNATNAPRCCPKCKTVLHLPRNTPGWPDRIYLRGDTLLVVEFKTDRTYPTPQQRAYLDAFRQVRRVVVRVWKPRDFEDVQEVLG